MKAVSGFDYHYFDDPDAMGYRGYSRAVWASDPTPPWQQVAQYCVENHVNSAIDVGCAKGFLVEELLSRGIEAEGFDISQYALSFASHLPCYRHDLRLGVIRPADAVIVLGVLQYLSSPAEVQTALTSIRRSTRKLLLLSCHYSESRQIVPDPLRMITRPRQWWRQMVETTGFLFTSDETSFDAFAAV